MAWIVGVGVTVESRRVGAGGSEWQTIVARRVMTVIANPY
jgi:hypothetical protein